MALSDKRQRGLPRLLPALEFPPVILAVPLARNRILVQEIGILSRLLQGSDRKWP